MATVISICNLAIAMTGQSGAIQSLNEPGPQALQCSAHYEQCRDEVLGSFPWGFNTKRVSLALVGESLVPGWHYCYGYPSDALRVWEVVPPGIRMPTPSQVVPYEVASYNDQTVICTDQPTPVVRYGYRVLDPARFPAMVVSVIAALLATRIAKALTGMDEIVARCERNYYRALSAATAADANESEQGEPPCELIQARE